MNFPSHILAVCNIAKANDDHNKCALTQEHLYVTCKGKHHAFELDQITKISFKQKKLLFPLVLGGIVGSLFLIAGFNFLVNIWMALIIGLAGMLLFYYGWVGSQTLTIHTKIKEYDIFIDQVTTPLQAFVAMVNENFILGKHKTITYYLPLSKEDWLISSKQGYVDSPNIGLNIYSKHLDTDDIVIVIDPTKVPNPINYQMDESSDAIVPYIYDRIDIRHVHILNN